MSGLLTGRYLTLILSGAALPQSASVLRLCRFPCGKPLAFRVPTNLTWGYPTKRLSRSYRSSVYGKPEAFRKERGRAAI